MNSSKNICRYIPTSSSANDLIAVDFVYERSWSCDTPFITAANRVHIVTGGEGELITNSCREPLHRGDLFFTFLSREYTILNTQNLNYMYISFIGNRASPLFERLGVRADQPVYHGFEYLEPFWTESLERASQSNSDLVAESVLFYTFSYLSAHPIGNEGSHSEETTNTVTQVKKYVDDHFMDPDISLQGVASKFGYNSKYLSHLFKSLMRLSFSRYLLQLRMQYAQRLIECGYNSISNIAFSCGFRDPLYFSRVFRNYFDCTPSEMISARNNAPAQTIAPSELMDISSTQESDADSAEPPVFVSPAAESTSSSEDWKGTKQEIIANPNV